jgi:putative tricarboxylic transport membrane protein
LRPKAARLRSILPHGVMLLVACFLYWAAGRIDAPTGGRIGPHVWPKAVIVFMGLLCAYEIAKRLLVSSDFEARGLLAGSQLPEGERREEPAEDHRMLAAGIALIAGYVVVVPWTGFFVATALFLALFQWAGGLRRPVLSAVIGLAGSLVLVVVFMRVAYISLPLGEGPFRSLSIALMRAIGVT